MEELFDDGTSGDLESGGLNRTGTYSVNIQLRRDIPQILPILGRRVKIYYKGIQKLCPNCFGPHPKKVCHTRKVEWRDYIKKFKEIHNDIPENLFGKWSNPIDSPNIPPEVSDCPAEDTTTNQINLPILSGEAPLLQHSLPTIDPLTATADWVSSSPGALENDTQEPSNQPTQASTSSNGMAISNESNTLKSGEPRREDFLVPLSRAEHDLMVDRLITGGSLLGEAEQIIASRKIAFNKAMKEYNKKTAKTAKASQKGTKYQRRSQGYSKRVESMSDDYVN